MESNGDYIDKKRGDIMVRKTRSDKGIPRKKRHCRQCKVPLTWKHKDQRTLCPTCRKINRIENLMNAKNKHPNTFRLGAIKAGAVLKAKAEKKRAAIFCFADHCSPRIEEHQRKIRRMERERLERDKFKRI